MRYNVGDTLFFVKIDFTPSESNALGSSLYMPWKGDKLNEIKIIKLKVTEHHKVAWEHDPNDKLEHDGYVLREIVKINDQSAIYGDTYHNQYPVASYGQMDNSFDRIVFRKDCSNDEFWGPRFVLLTHALKHLRQAETPKADDPHALPETHRKMLEAHRMEIEEVFRSQFAMTVTYRPLVVRHADGHRKAVAKLLQAKFYPVPTGNDQTMPQYEIWGLDNTPSDMDGGNGSFREDFLDFATAKEALPGWQTSGRAAWIQHKETGEVLR